MAVSNRSYVFRCLDQGMSSPYPLSSWEKVLQSDFAIVKPWLIPTENPATTMPCEQSSSTSCCYRIVERPDGGIVGVCDEGYCERRVFTKAEIVQYKPNFSRLRKDLAGLLQAIPDRRPITQTYLVSVGTITICGEAFGIHMGGGDSAETLFKMINRLWMDTNQRQIILSPSILSQNEGLDSFLRKAEWPKFTLDGNFELTPKRLEWSLQGKQQWRVLLNGLDGSVNEAQGSPYLYAIERGFAEIGKDFHKLKEENTALKEGLADRLSAISREVEPEYFQWILTVLAAGSISKAASMLGMAKSTFDEKLKRYRIKGGTYAILFDLVGIRRKVIGVRKLERFNESFLEHQPVISSSDNGLLMEVISALEAQDQNTWPAIRDELLDLLQEHG